ncbi:hypothetical protein [Lysobacter niastensis]|uniref:Uncharacterized protein n=1 Tax=Lysobacter niastensis TaxID=380629 RepID=A0ABS0B6D1_9GAMM|nr:hypothetical protein [Lysobacter niastensis]MBF6024594.1 hypothetical protein [Lysobacter niastensis]
MSRAIHHDHVVAHDAHEVVMEVIESPDVLEDFLCVPMPVAEHAGILVPPPARERDEMPAEQRSVYRFWH